MEDGSYMRLKVLQIGYSLPGQMLQRVGVKGLRFFVQGENLFTITNYSGYDPEVGTRDGFDGEHIRKHVLILSVRILHLINLKLDTMNKILKVLALGAMALSTTACSDFWK